jgi:tryptophan-rich sensory protein
VATCLIIVSAINAALLAFASGGISLIPSVTRFTFTCVLSVFLFRQASWARWLIGILSLLGSIVTIIGWFGLVATTVSLFSVISIWMILMAPFYLWVAYTLLLDKDVANLFNPSSGF